MSKLFQWVGDALDSVDDTAADTIHKLRKQPKKNDGDDVEERDSGHMNGVSDRNGEQVSDDDHSGTSLSHASSSPITTPTTVSTSQQVAPQANTSMKVREIPIAASITHDHVSSSSGGNAEVEGLRAVWNEARERNERLKSIIKDQEGKFKDRLSEQSDMYEEKLREQSAQHTQQILEMRSLLSENQSDFDKALKAKESFRATQSRQLEHYVERMEEYESQIARLNEQICELENECMNVREQQTKSAETAAQLVKQIREEALDRERALEEEKKMRKSTLHAVQTREATLEAGTVEYMNALAATQREVEEKSRELQKVVSEHRWLEVDKRAAEDRLVAANAQIDTLSSRLENWQHRDNEQHQRLAHELKEVNKENQLLSTELLAAQEQVAKLETRLASDESMKALTMRQRELETRVRTMADHVMQKQSVVDSLTAERSALRLQLGSSEKQSRALQQEVIVLRQRLTEADLSDTDDDSTNNHTNDVRVVVDDGTHMSTSETSGLRSRNATISKMSLQDRKSHRSRRRQAFNTSTPGVRQAVSMFDRFGAVMGASLRRYPAFRVMFAMYAILLHVWVAFVFYHFAHHQLEPAAASSQGDTVISGASPLLSPPLSNTAT